MRKNNVLTNGNRSTAAGDVPIAPPRLRGHDECLQCATQLAGYQERLRVLRHELDKHRRWMEARALRLDCLIGDIEIALENAPSASGPVPGRTSTKPHRVCHLRPEVTASALHAVPRGDGYWDITIDALPTFRLPPMLGRLFDLLAKDSCPDVDDGLVGFKSNAYLLTSLRRSVLPPDSTLRRGVGRLSARALAQAICDLRKRLGRSVLHGDALVQTRRGVGRRIALRKPDTADRD